MIRFPFNEVEGLVSPADKETLVSLARLYSKLDGEVLEIGSYKGLSTLSLLFGLGTRRLWAFDFSNFLPEFEMNLRLAGMRDRVIVCIGDFRETFPIVSCNLRRIALAFVDHDHRVETTRAAFELLHPNLVPGGAILFHDFGHGDYLEATNYLKSIGAEEYGLGLGIIRKST